MTDRIVIESNLLAGYGFAHGFSLRTGGSSLPPFDSLNLGRALGDDPAAVEANHARLARAIGYASGTLFELSQVHGTSLRWIGPRESPEDVRAERGDALIATTRGTAIGVRVADCAAVLAADRRTGAVAAVHAGWRGAVAGIVTRALIALMERTGGAKEDILVALGPHIRVAAFEIGEEVARELERAAPRAGAVRAGSPRPFGDLSRVLRHQLAELGLADDQIDDTGGCTYSEPDRFFSFRRDGHESGRHVAAIVARG